MPPATTLTAVNYIDGVFEDHKLPTLEVISPLDGQLIAEVLRSDAATLDRAVTVAGRAFPDWSGRTLKERVQVFFRFRQLLADHLEELAELIVLENGKTLDEARAEIHKGMELCEFACSLPQVVRDEVQEVSQDIECRTAHRPLGVVASIVPFNFPHMVPMWTIPNAIALGNCLIVKPSEVVPLSVLRIAELLQEAGLPPGVFNVVNGDREIVEAICDHPGIRAVSFVGSTRVARIVYRRASSHLKRVLCMGGAKNHLIVLPDAKQEICAANIAASVTGCAGQRCMAASAMVGVGRIDHIIEAICAEARKIVPGENLGAVISAAARDRIISYIDEAEREGAEILVDGRGTTVHGREGGFYVGPTIIDRVRPDMKIAREEVFGPVLAIMRADDVDEAIRIENDSPYGNAASVFTQNGKMADYVAERVSVGMVGVNIGVPVPREPFSFGGWNDSRFGAGDITGRSSIHFWTQLKKTTTKWNPEAWRDWMS